MPTFKKIAEIVNGEVLGKDTNHDILALASYPNLAKSNELALIFPTKPSKALKLLSESPARFFIIADTLKNDESFKEHLQKFNDLNFIFVKRPRYALKQIIGLFAKTRYSPSLGIHSSAVVEQGAIIDESASIGAMSFIGPGSKIGPGVKIYPRVTIGLNVEIQAHSVIHSGVVIEDYVQIGKRVIIHANTVIGSDGYSYVTEEPSNLEKMQNGNFNFSLNRQIQEKIISIGSVIIADDVEIGANTVIDRGTIGSTIIGEGTKIDNLCQIAHNVQIGRDCLIVANVGLAGSVKVADRVTIAGGSGCGDGVEIGNDAVIGAYCAVNSNIDPFMPMLGIPAIPHGEFMKRQKAIARLPQYREELRKLEKKVEELAKNHLHSWN